MAGCRCKIHGHGSLGSSSPPPTCAPTVEEVNSRAAGIPRVFQRLMLWAPPSPTVGEETTLGRPALWLLTVLLPCVVLGMSAALTVSFYIDLPELAASAPWRGPAVMLGGVFPAVVLCYMHLFLPRAPLALIEYGCCGIGALLWCSGCLVACFGSTWVFIALACLVAVLVAGVIAFWICLARVYG